MIINSFIIRSIAISQFKSLFIAYLKTIWPIYLFIRIHPRIAYENCIQEEKMFLGVFHIFFFYIYFVANLVSFQQTSDSIHNN